MLLSWAEILPFISKWLGSYFVNILADFKEVPNNAVIIVGGTAIFPREGDGAEMH